MIKRPVLLLLLLISLVYTAVAQPEPELPLGPSLLPEIQLPKKDALVIYNQGRNLEAAGKTADAAAKYREAVAICDDELKLDPARMDAYTVKCWALFGLAQYRTILDVGNAALKVRSDPRITEIMGRAYFHLNDDITALKYFQRYIDNVTEYADRVPSAYFYMAESYLRLKRYDHADIAYAMATYREGSIAWWWNRYGLAIEYMGDYARAQELYSRALRLSPDLPEAKDGLARVRAQL